MSNFLANWAGRMPDMSAVVKRFPAPVVIMAVFTAIWIYIGDFYGPEDKLLRGMLGLVVAAYLGVIMTVAREAKSKPNLWPIQIFLAAAIFALFWFSEYLRLNLFMALGGVLLALGNAIVWRKARNDTHLWDFTHKIWTGGAFSALGCGIYMLGVFAIMAALKTLFGLDIKDLVLHILLPIGLGFLAPLYWLSTVPTVDESYEELYDNPGFVSKAVAFLGTWLLAPLTLIYALILLAYAVKIVLAGELPKGEIAQLTFPFLLIGTLTWLLLEPPFVREKTLARIFRKIWWMLSVPAAVMLAISIFVRIGEYGLTQERIALILLVIWSLGLACWFIFAPKEKRDIRLIPGFGSALLILGFIIAGWLSVQSQGVRLERTLTMMKSVEKLDVKMAQKAKGSLLYLWRNQARDKARGIIKAVGYDVASEDNLDKIYTTLNLATVRMPSRYGPSNASLEYNYTRQLRAIPVTGYDYVMGDYYFNLANENNSYAVMFESAEVKNTDGIIIVEENGSEIGRFDVKAWLASLQTDQKTLLGIDAPQVIYQDESREIALLVKHITYFSDADGADKVSGSMGYDLLVRGFTPTP